MVHYYLLSIMLLNIENKSLHGAYILAGFAICLLLAFIMHLHVGAFFIYYWLFLGKYVLMVFLEKLVFMVVCI